MKTKRDLTPDLRKRCSNCNKRIEPDENVWCTSEHRKILPGLYKGKKAKLIAFDLLFQKAIYCHDCTSKFDMIISKIDKKS